MRAKQLRRATITGMALSSALLLAACSSDSDTSSDASGNTDGKANISAVIKGLDNPFFQYMQQGIEAEGSDLGVQTAVQAAADVSDETGQADRLLAAAGQGYSCYIVNPTTATNLIQPLAQIAADSSKTIVSIDQPIDADAAAAANATPDIYIGTDNVQAGEKAAQEMNKLLPDGGKVAVITGVTGNVTSNDRVSGFTDNLNDNITVVQTTNGDWLRELALTKAGDIIRANSDIKGFFAANDDMGLGIGKAVTDAGKTTADIKVISVDGNADALEAVKAGTLSASVAQYPYVVGELGVQACQVAALGKTLPATVVSPTQVVNKDNVEAAQSAAPRPSESFDNPLEALLND